MARTTLDERDLRRVTLRVPIDQHEALVTLARAMGISLNRMAVKALHGYLVEHGRWERVESWLLRTGERYVATLDDLAS